MRYTKHHSDELTDILASTTSKQLDVSDAPAEGRIKMLQSLVKALETALKIVDERYCADPPKAEPFPGAAAQVVKQARAGIELARQTGLIP